MPDAPPIYRLVSIDPGTAKMGIALIDYDMVAQHVTIQHAQTLISDNRVKDWSFMHETRGSRYTRLASHQKSLAWFLADTQPRCVVAESAHMGLYATAYEALVECLQMVQQTVWAYDPYINLQTLDATSVKTQIGAPARKPKTMDRETFKQSVSHALAGHPGIYWAPNVALSALDEHGVDACAVGVSWLLSLACPVKAPA